MSYVLRLLCQIRLLQAVGITGPLITPPALLHKRSIPTCAYISGDISTRHFPDQSRSRNISNPQVEGDATNVDYADKPFTCPNETFTYSYGRLFNEPW